MAVPQGEKVEATTEGAGSSLRWSPGKAWVVTCARYVACALLALCAGCGDDADRGAVEVADDADDFGDGSVGEGDEGEEVVEHRDCTDPNVHPECRAEPVRSAETCPGERFEHPYIAGPGFCAPVPPTPPEPPAPVALPRDASDGPPIVVQDCPDVLRGTCHTPIPCAAPGERFPEEDALREAVGAASDAAIVYLDASAPEPGSGTRADPYPSFEQILGDIEPGTIVALAEGPYTVDLIVSGGLSIVGACDGRTTIVGRERPGIKAVVQIVGYQTVHLFNLEVVANGRGIHLSGDGAHVLRHVSVHDAERYALVLEENASAFVADARLGGDASGSGETSCTELRENASLRAYRVACLGRYTRGVLAAEHAYAELYDLTFGGDSIFPSIAVQPRDGADVRVTRVAFERTFSRLVEVARMSEAFSAPFALVRDAHVGRWSAPEGTAQPILGVVTGRDAELTIERMAVDWIGGQGVGAEYGGRLQISDLTVHRVGFEEGRLSFLVQGGDPGTRLEIRRVRVEESQAMVVNGIGIERAVVEDLYVGTQRARPDGFAPFSPTINIVSVESAEINRLRISTEVALGIALGNTAVRAVDLEVTATATHDVLRIHRGISVQFGGTMDGERWRIQGFPNGAAIMDLPHGQDTLTDIVVVDTFEGDQSVFGIGRATGFGVQHSAGVSVERLAVLSPKGRSVTVRDADVHITDLLMDQQGTYAYSSRFEVVEPARVELHRAAFLQPRSAAIALFGVGAFIRARDIFVLEATGSPCTGGDGCSPAGCAVVGVDSNLDLGKFWFEASSLGGICLKGESTLQAVSGTLAHNPVGLVVTETSLDLDDATTDVVVIGDGQRVSTDSFFVPEPAAFE